MEDDPIAERVRTVYGKDLHDDYFNLNVRIPSEEFDHGDTIRVVVTEYDNSADRGISEGSEAEEL